MAAPQPGLGGGNAAPPRRNPEEYFYTLSLDGRAAGSARWWAGPEKGGWVIRRETSFSGPLPPSRKLEVSRLDGRTGLPQQFTETTEGGGRGQYEAVFDRRSGLVTVRQGRDEASIPYVADMHDPLSLLQYLRELPDDVTTTRVPLAGGNVLATRLADQELETPWGVRLARVYYLRPGLAFVYVEADGPRRPLRFTQNLSIGVLDAVIGRGGTARPPMSERQGQARQAPGSRQGERGPQARQPERGQQARQPERGQQARQGRPEPGRRGQQPQQPAQAARQRDNERRGDGQGPPQPPAAAPEAGAGGGGARRKRRRGRRGGGTPGNGQ
ncbi:MAG TPA: hypothetical protein VNT60_11195 [Deinococcales bacterium]|nr:hypothetical protein [Deinococcales bacterium]